MAKLFAKRSICFFLTNSLKEAEYDYHICATIDANIAKLCLINVLNFIKISTALYLDQPLIKKKIFQLQNDESLRKKKVIKVHPKVKYDPQMLSLWYDNRAKNRFSQDGAHFLCAKTNIAAGVKVLEEMPIVTVTSSDDMLICAGCNQTLFQSSFWPCDTCDEAVFCSMDCSILNERTHRFECGLATYLHTNLSPVGVILFKMYIRTSQCPVQYDNRLDLHIRSHLPTDADVHFAGFPGGAVKHPSKLHKRSYQYRYFLLANSALKWSPLCSLHKLQPFEAMIALRESADSKDDVLPPIEQSVKVNTIFRESIHILFALEMATKSSISESFTQSLTTKYRLKGIIEDYCRLYRLNEGHGQFEIAPEGSTNSSTAKKNRIFTQPILSTSFWPSSTPNVKSSYCSESGTIQYHTIRSVNRFDKLFISFPSDQEL